MKRAAVIGGGASGLIAAAFCARRGIKTHLFEKNSYPGKKIGITGKGRCNITNAGDLDQFIQNIPGNPYFLYSALASFDSAQTIELFESLGVPTKVERGMRVYPVSDKAADVRKALVRFAEKSGVIIHMDSAVKNINSENSKICGVTLENGKKEAFDGVILATGGLSYPATGSTGDGYRMAKELGHNITKLYPSLVSMHAKERFCERLMGLTLKNISINIKNSRGKSVYKDFGELLFTHFGVTGPVILSGSRHLIPFDEEGYDLFIDLKPALDESRLDARILRDFDSRKNKSFKNSLDELLPKSMIPVIIELSGIDPEKKVNSITQKERHELGRLLKNFKLTLTHPGSFNEAVITSGGINTKEIDPGTMESKLIKNLFFAGEIIDVDAYTGGFNLQIAFSTGYLAGNSIFLE
ncbi:MAG: NAD(P)/FAD-dependent oxidoreductase [Firmicutes bacterium]|nr:NAD(P)/FAD-dependent oxidoreductase [Bacillota bacterium]